MKTEQELELEIRETAIILTIEYFNGKSPNEITFMTFMERIYTFLKTGETNKNQLI